MRTKIYDILKKYEVECTSTQIINDLTQCIIDARIDQLIFIKEQIKDITCPDSNILMACIISIISTEVDILLPIHPEIKTKYKQNLKDIKNGKTF